MALYQAPLFWFSPQMLRRWLWTARSNYLSEDTKDNLCLLLDGVQDDADFHSVIHHVILNADYARILECLNPDEFQRFVDDTISLWTDPALHPEWLDHSSSLYVRDRYNRIKAALKKAFGQSNLRPRLCTWGLLSEIERSASLVCSSLNLANFQEGVRTAKAQQEVRNGCDTALERVEKLLDLFLRFAVSLSYVCGTPIDAPNVTEWGPKELALHNASTEILSNAMNGSLTDDVAHLEANIRRFATLCNGTTIESKKRKEVRLASGDDLPPGQLMLLFSRFRGLRNEVGHVTSTIRSEGGLPEGLINAAKSIIPAVNEFVKVIRGETCFPEIVRITSLEQSTNGIELHVVAVPTEREYQAVYPDETLMKSLARDAQVSLAYTEGDQDFWLFPTPASYHAHLLNPLLLPLENREDYKTETVTLEIARQLPPPEPKDVAGNSNEGALEQEIV